MKKFFRVYYLTQDAFLQSLGAGLFEDYAEAFSTGRDNVRRSGGKFISFVITNNKGEVYHISSKVET